MLQAVRRSAPPELLHMLRDAGGVSAGTVGREARTPLCAAAATGDATSVRCLLDLNADVAAADPNGATALHFCADRGSSQCARLLLDCSADLEATDAHGNTPLHAAGRRGHEDLYQVLLVAGARPDAINGRGRQPKLLDAAEADAACVVS